MTRSVLNFTFSGGSTDDLMASTNALRIVCEKTFADCEWTINVDVSRQGSTLTVAVDGATFENVRALSEQYTTHLRTTTFKYAKPYSVILVTAPEAELISRAMRRGDRADEVDLVVSTVTPEIEIGSKKIPPREFYSPDYHRAD